ncbi:MAG TPA: RNA polymerase sigma-70 factor [Gemmatimonadaceae bacterium]|nr:RNA polymerase sigma-70 factor [Gemmatimonadaceae bacterium]
MTPSLEPIGGDRSTGEDDREIVAAIRQGSALAFRALFSAHYEALCRYAYRFVHTRAIAEELVSDVFLRIWTQRARWDVHGNVRAYLFSATRNLAIDHLRRELVERRSLDHTSRELRASGGGASLGDADDRLMAAEVAAAMQRAVDELPPRPRQVFLLRWQRHLTNVEIASALGIAVKTVEMHMTRALDALRGSLAPDLLGD